MPDALSENLRVFAGRSAFVFRNNYFRLYTASNLLRERAPLPLAYGGCAAPCFQRGSQPEVACELKIAQCWRLGFLTRLSFVCELLSRPHEPTSAFTRPQLRKQ